MQMDVTHRVEYMSWVKIVMQSQGKDIVIVKLVKLELPKIHKKFEELKDEHTRNQRVFSTITGFHGTQPQNIEAITKNGFDISKIQRSLYGHGLYFARDAGVAINYASPGNQIFLCNLIDIDLTWVQQHNYYIVRNDRAILPLYLITYAITKSETSNFT